MRGDEGLDVAQRKPRPAMRRPDRAQHEGVAGNDVGAERIAPFDLGASVQPRDARADLAVRRRLHASTVRSVLHRLDDLGIAGAQRQSTPPSAFSISAADGAGVASRSAAAPTSTPGVQAPHCAAPAS